MDKKVAEMILGKKAIMLQKEITDLICYSLNAQRIFILAKSINPVIPKGIGFCAAVIHCLIDENVIKLNKKGGK